MAKNKLFETVKLQKPPRSKFDLSHDVKQSMKFGFLYPSMVMECVPGDKINISCEALLRFAPLLAPVMHRVDVYMHYFFVPTRLLWDEWEDFITQQPYDGVPPTHPWIELKNIEADWQTFISYFGLPKKEFALVDGPKINPFPFAAYQFIYNEYYRDQNLIPEVDYKCVSGDNTFGMSGFFAIRLRAWEHDYFTSALPFAQKGPAVSLPVGTFTSDVQLKDDVIQGIFREAASHAPLGGDVTGDVGTGGLEVGAIPLPGVYDPNGSLEVTGDLAATTINDLRRAYRLQEWFEKQARGGTRYIEQILSHFGVRSSDARLNRPEYITGTKAPVTISEVLQTSGDVEGVTSTPQGTMAGHGVSVTSGNYGSYYCEEHGYILGICSVMPKTAYQDGIPKMYLKMSDPFDYYWPEFANLGEQEILNVELYGESATPDTVFGYIPRYSEYKFLNNRTAGDFQDTLAFWTITRIFEAQPALNGDFINCVPRTDIFAVNDGTDYLWAHIYHKITAIRPMPFFGTPTF